MRSRGPQIGGGAQLFVFSRTDLPAAGAFPTTATVEPFRPSAEADSRTLEDGGSVGAAARSCFTPPDELRDFGTKLLCACSSQELDLVGLQWPLLEDARSDSAGRRRRSELPGSSLRLVLL